MGQGGEKPLERYGRAKGVSEDGVAFQWQVETWLERKDRRNEQVLFEDCRNVRS
jgi:hypothetical protein